MPETRDRGHIAAQRAVCFDRRDYAGPGRRIAIVCIDFVATVVLCLAAMLALAYIYYTLSPRRDFPPAVIWVPPLAGYLYLAVLKRSRVRTLGYIITGVRIVDIEGQRPTLLQMTTRLWPLLPLPWSFLFDLGWVVDEPQRQTLRDKWAATFVVRRNAQPIARASVRYKRIGFGGIFLIFPEVSQPPNMIQPAA